MGDARGPDAGRHRIAPPGLPRRDPGSALRSGRDDGGYARTHPVPATVTPSSAVSPHPPPCHPTPPPHRHPPPLSHPGPTRDPRSLPPRADPGSALRSGRDDGGGTRALTPSSALSPRLRHCHPNLRRVTPSSAVPPYPPPPHPPLSVIPGLTRDPGSLPPRWIPALRCAPAGMTQSGVPRPLTAKCSPAAHSRKGAAQRNLVRDPAQKCAAQRLVPALRQSGSALRAESLRWIPDTLPLSLQGSGTCDAPRPGRS